MHTPDTIPTDLRGANLYGAKIKKGEEEKLLTMTLPLTELREMQKRLEDGEPFAHSDFGYMAPKVLSQLIALEEWKEELDKKV